MVFIRPLAGMAEKRALPLVQAGPIGRTFIVEARRRKSIALLPQREGQISRQLA